MIALAAVAYIAGCISGAMVFALCMYRATSYDDDPVSLPDDIEVLDDGKVRFR